MATQDTTSGIVDYNLIFKRGKKTVIDVQFADDDDNPIDISNDDFLCQIRSSPNSSKKLFEFLKSDNSMQVIGTDTLRLTITKAASLTIPTGVLYWDLYRNTGAKDMYVFEGKATEEPSVSR